MDIDLNNDPLNPNMQEVIINPVVAPEIQNGNAMADNNLPNVAKEEAIQIIGQNPSFDLNGPPCSSRATALPGSS